MVYKKLGSSELYISSIAFGCMSLPHDQKENDRIIHHAIAKGINYFDTADIYDEGNNEIALGKSFKGKRKDVLIATKGGNEPRTGGGFNWNASKDYLLKAVEKSLRRLQTDYIDLYQLHGGTIDDPIDETIAAFELLQQQGKIRYYGISSIRPNVIREYVKRSSITSVMMQYSILDRRAEESCLSLLQENNIGVLVRGTMAGGLLVDKPAKPYLEHSEEEVKNAVDIIHKLSGRHRNAGQTAVLFALANPAVSSAVIGIRTYKQLDEALKVLQVPALTLDELNILRSAIEPNKYTQHR